MSFSCHAPRGLETTPQPQPPTVPTPHKERVMPDIDYPEDDFDIDDFALDDDSGSLDEFDRSADLGLQRLARAGTTDG
jgi:hypothetical protein